MQSEVMEQPTLPAKFYINKAMACLHKASFARKAHLVAEELYHLKNFKALVDTLHSHPLYLSKNNDKHIMELHFYLADTKKRLAELQGGSCWSLSADPVDVHSCALSPRFCLKEAPSNGSKSVASLSLHQEEGSFTSKSKSSTLLQAEVVSCVPPLSDRSWSPKAAHSESLDTSVGNVYPQSQLKSHSPSQLTKHLRKVMNRALTLAESPFNKVVEHAKDDSSFGSVMNEFVDQNDQNIDSERTDNDKFIAGCNSTLSPSAGGIIHLCSVEKHLNGNLETSSIVSVSSTECLRGAQSMKESVDISQSASEGSENEESCALKNGARFISKGALLADGESSLREHNRAWGEDLDQIDSDSETQISETPSQKLIVHQEVQHRGDSQLQSGDDTRCGTLALQLPSHEAYNDHASSLDSELKTTAPTVLGNDPKGNSQWGMMPKPYGDMRNRKLKNSAGFKHNFSRKVDTSKNRKHIVSQKLIMDRFIHQMDELSMLKQLNYAKAQKLGEFRVHKQRELRSPTPVIFESLKVKANKRRGSPPLWNSLEDHFHHSQDTEKQFESPSQRQTTFSNPVFDIEQISSDGSLVGQLTTDSFEAVHRS